MVNPPNGTVTFLFTDIEGSTKLAQLFPDVLPAALLRHQEILNECIISNRGFLFEIIGDAFCAAFADPFDAVRASYEAQVRLNSEKWKDVRIKVRMGIHRGYAEWNGKRYMGYITLARTQRVMSAAHGGQVLVSEDAYNYISSNEKTDISFRDLGERRLKDLIQPVRIFQLISKELPSDFPPLATLDARPNNLPVQLTSFIGRKNEIEEVKKLLGNTHLLTLTGPGGAGKTRLALQAGAEVIDDFANGVWIVDLAPLFDPQLLPQEILKELGLKEETKKTIEETLTGYLKDKDLLLILDNCEHLIESCAVLTEKLLTSCSGLKIMATSREAMKCTGEQTHSISSMEIPNPKGHLSPEQLSQFESVRLFIERALSVSPKFRVTDENAPALAGICSQLDGIPLAIELAAARIKVMTIEKIFERLSNRFSLLTGGKRTALPRQQTLKALIDWSYDLLSEQEKILWNRLSVFNDGWTMESAEEICSDEKVNKDDIFEILSLLVEKSIIIFSEESERFSILETLKRYAEERLAESNETIDVFSKHMLYHLKLAESAEQKLKGEEMQYWLDKLEAEHGNLQSAIEWSLKNGHNENGLRLAGSLGLFWDIRGYLSVGRRLLENALSNPNGAGKSVIAKALTRAGTLLKNQGDYERASEYYEQSLTLYKEAGDNNGISTCLHNLGAIAFEKGDYELARKLLEKNLAFNRDRGDKESIAFTLNELGNMAYDQGDYMQARKFHEESLALREELGHKRGIASSLNNLANVLNNQGDDETAKKMYEKSLAIKRELGDKRGITTTLHNFGVFYSYVGDYALARKYFEESIALAREIGDKQGIAETLYGMGSVEYKQANREQALKFYEESLRLRWEVRNKLGMVYCIMGIADIARIENNITRAACLLGFVDTALRSMNTVFEKDDLAKYELALGYIYKSLSNQAVSESWEEGKNLTLEQAAELALNA